MLNKINKAQFYCFLLLVFWVPIPLGSNRPWAWAIIEVVAFSLLAVHILLTLKYKTSFTKPIKRYFPLLAMYMFILLWMIFQLLPLPEALIHILSPSLKDAFSYFPEHLQYLSVDPSETYVEFLKSASYFTLMLLSLLLVTSEKRLKMLLIVMVLSGAFQAVYGTLQALSGNPLSWVIQTRNSNIATGSFIYKNHFANYLLLSLSIGIGLLVANLSSYRPENNKAKLRQMVSALLQGKAVIRIALALMVIGLVMSKSRMGNAAFFVSLTFTGCIAFFYFKNRTRGLTYLLLSLFIIDTFILGAWFGIDKVKDRLEATSFSQETRDEVNVEGLSLIKKFPVTGSGAGTFYTIFPSVQSKNIPYFYDHAHNDYLQFTIEYGLPATMVLAVMVLSSLWHCFYTIKNRRHTLMKGVAFGCMMAIIGMLIHITVDFNLQAPANAVYFTLILTLAWQSRYAFPHKSKTQQDQNT